jgi:hypothetical protein
MVTFKVHSVLSGSCTSVNTCVLAYDGPGSCNCFGVLSSGIFIFFFFSLSFLFLFKEKVDIYEIPEVGLLFNCMTLFCLLISIF